MKKIVFLSLFVSMFWACSNPLEEAALSVSAPTGAESRAFGQDPVELVLVNSYVHTAYGVSQLQRRIDIRLHNLAYQKDVDVVHEEGNGTWTDYPASYVETLPDGTEIWSTFILENYITLGTKFAIRYTVNGTTYWDNNDGADYNVGHNIGTYLGEGINVKQENAYFATNLFGVIDIRNLAFAKVVQIVYTTDDWATTQYANATYVGPTYNYGYSTINSPNAYGIEKWSFNVNLGTSTEVEYVISYTTNGVTYWDNNYGRNYILQK